MSTLYLSQSTESTSLSSFVTGLPEHSDLNRFFFITIIIITIIVIIISITELLPIVIIIIATSITIAINIIIRSCKLIFVFVFYEPSSLVAGHQLHLTPVTGLALFMTG